MTRESSPRRGVSAALAFAVALAFLAPGAAADRLQLLTPETIDAYERTRDGIAICGIAADYATTTGVLRVELETRADGDGRRIAWRAFHPTAFGPPLRDLWLKTDSFQSLGRFATARENGNGIMEAGGSLPPDAAHQVLRDVMERGAEISLIIDGTYPVSRFPIALPAPLPDPARSKFAGCIAAAGPAR